MPESIKCGSRRVKVESLRALSQNCRGFGLVEICVVLAIVAVIATIGTPWLLAMRAKSSIRSDARDVHSVLRQAQTEAVKRNEIACVEINPAGTYRIMIESYFGEDVAGKEIALRQKSLRPGNRFDLTMADYFTTACFNPRGLASKKGAVGVTNNNNLLTMEVRVQPSGHVKSLATDW